MNLTCRLEVFSTKKSENLCTIFYMLQDFVARNPDLVACEQQKRSPARAFAQSDQRLFVLFLERLIDAFATCEISRLSLSL